MVLPAGAARGPVSSRVLSTVIVLLLVATFAVPTAALIPVGFAGPSVTTTPTRPGPDRIGASQLDQAISSLSMGAGPAHGLPTHCAPVGGVAAHCGALSPHTLAHPSVSNPYGWLNATGSDWAGTVGVSYWASMAWDPLDQLIVYFGGCDPTACPDSQTWVFFYGYWYNATSPSQSPPAVIGASMDFDYVAQAVVLFGGCDVVLCPDNETWTYTTGTGWLNVSGPHSYLGFTFWPPTPRWQAAMAFGNETSDNTTILFGGCLDINCFALDNTTWEWVGAAGLDVWYQAATSGPSPRWGASMVFDAITQSIILFGGCGTSSTCRLNDTWSFYAGGWSNVSGYVLSYGPAPSGRGGYEMTYDTATGQLLLVGGINDSLVVTNDTWALVCFFVCGWVNITPSVNLPADLYFGAMAGESSSTIPLLYGGECLCSSGYLNGTWVFEPTLTINPAVTPNPAPARSAVDFSSNAAGGTSPYYSDWTFGDGSISYGDGSYNYTTPGTYVVNVYVWDWYGVETTYTTTVTITGTTAAAQANPSTTDIGRPVTLSTADPTGGVGPYLYVWSFGDGTSDSTVAAPTHTYATNGTYVAMLSVVDSHGLYSNTSVDVTVVPLPTVTAAATPSAADVGGAMSFSATPSGGVGPFTYAWNFSDGTASGVVAPVHTFSSSGTYTVHVIATDSVGGAANHSVTVTVYPALGGTASATPTAVQTEAMVSFSASGTGGSGSYTYHWTFGDGSTGTTGAATHSYTTAGTYTAKVWINDSVGGSFIQTVAVTVTAPGSGGSNTSSGSGGLGGWALWVVLIVVIAVIALVAVMMMRRKPGAPASAPPTGAAGGPSPPPAAASPPEWAESPPPSK